MNINFSDFFNLYDVVFLIIIFISIFFGIKNGIIKSLFNLIKWILIVYLIKNCFTVLRPYFDQYITNQTISDILIFFSTLIISYIFFSFINRIIIGIIQPKKSGLVDISFGAVLGTLRGYIIFVILIFFISSNTSSFSLPKFLLDGSFNSIADYGVDFLKQMPREIDVIQDLDL